MTDRELLDVLLAAEQTTDTLIEHVLTVLIQYGWPRIEWAMKDGYAAPGDEELAWAMRTLSAYRDLLRKKQAQTP